MVFSDIGADVILVQMRVNFCGRDAFMTQHLLHGAQVGASLHQVRGKRMAEGVRTDLLFNTGILGPLLDQHEHHFAREVAAATVQEDIVLLALLAFQLLALPVHI